MPSTTAVPGLPERHLPQVFGLERPAPGARAGPSPRGELEERGGCSYARCKVGHRLLGNASCRAPHIHGTMTDMRVCATPAGEGGVALVKYLSDLLHLLCAKLEENQARHQRGSLGTADGWWSTAGA